MACRPASRVPSPRSAPLVRAWLAAAVALAAAAPPVAAGPIEGTPPYPPSPYITSFSLDWDSLRRLAAGSDNWASTWAGNGGVYSSWGDGGGLGGTQTEGRVSIGLARLSGTTAATLTGDDLIGGRNPRVARCWRLFPGELSDPNRAGPCHRTGRHGKSRSLLGLGGSLYAWVTPGSNIQGNAEARLYKAPLETNNWRRAAWAFTRNEPDRILSPAFVQAGRGHADGDGYVYAYANRYDPVVLDDTSIQRGGQVMLLRARETADLLARPSWQFFAGLDGSGAPTWTSSPAAKRPAIVIPEGVGRIGSAVYVASVGRYLFLSEYRRKSAGYFALLEAPKPWGPWRTVAYTRLVDPRGRVEAGFYFYSVLANSLRGGGTGFTLLFSGGGRGDALLAADGRLTLGGPPP